MGSGTHWCTSFSWCPPISRSLGAWWFHLLKLIAISTTRHTSRLPASGMVDSWDLFRHHLVSLSLSLSLPLRPEGLKGNTKDVSGSRFFFGGPRGRKKEKTVAGVSRLLRAGGELRGGIGPRALHEVCGVAHEILGCFNHPPCKKVDTFLGFSGKTP